MEDVIVYVVTGHCEYEDFACVSGVFTDKNIAETFMKACENDPQKHYSYYQIDPIILDHPEKDAE